MRPRWRRDRGAWLAPGDVREQVVPLVAGLGTVTMSTPPCAGEEQVGTLAVQVLAARTVLGSTHEPTVRPDLDGRHRVRVPAWWGVHPGAGWTCGASC